MTTRSELNDDQRLYLQTIFDYFHEQGKWLTYKTLDHKLTKIRRDLDIAEISKSLLMGFANGFAFNHDLNAPAALNIFAIYECSASKEDLADFVKAICYGVEKYFGAREDETTIVITSDELKEQLNLSELALRKVGLIIKDASEYHIYDSFGSREEDDWWIWTLSRDIRHFDGVESIEQYIKRLDTSKMASSKMSLGYISSAENAETFQSEGHHDLSGNLDKEENVTSIGQQYPYDVALSFAGEDRIHAETLAEALRRYGIKVFYDKYEKNTLWGKDLYIHLSDLYQNKARYCVMFFSQHYVTKTWTKHELRAAQARAFKEQQEYILPIRLDETEIPGILPTTAYLTWEKETVESIVQAILKKLGNISRKSVKGWLKESEEYREKGLYEKARIGCEQAIHIDPYNADSYYDYGWTLRKLKRNEEALTAFEQAIQYDTKDDIEYTLDIYRQKGYTLEALKRYEEALTIYEEVMQLKKAEEANAKYHHYSDYYGDLCDQGDALIGLDRYEGALAILEQAVQLALNSTSSYDRKRTRALSNKGYVLYLLDRYEEALVICERVFQLAPKDAYPYQLKGDILDELDRYEEALAFFEKAVDLDPRDAYTCRRKGELLYKLKRYEEALVTCEQAIQLNSSDPYTYETKSSILIALRCFDEAQDAHMLAMQYGYNE